MKKLIILTLCLASALCFAADQETQAAYSYRGTGISKKSYDRLFKYFKNRLFVTPEGSVTAPVNLGRNQEISICKKDSAGKISGRIIRIVNENTIILKVKESIIRTDYTGTVKRKDKTMYRFALHSGYVKYCPIPQCLDEKYFTVAVAGVDTSKLFQNEDFTANVVFSGAYTAPMTMGGQRLRKFAVLRPITEPEFKKYLDDGNELFYYQRKFSGYAPCPKCEGKGKIPNPKYVKGRVMSETLTCPDCKYGKIKQYTIVKVPVKAPKERVASR